MGTADPCEFLDPCEYYILAWSTEIEGALTPVATRALACHRKAVNTVTDQAAEIDRLEVILESMRN